MAATVTVCSHTAPPPVVAAQNCRRKYAPSMWGDFFLTHEPCTQEELVAMREKAQAMREEVRRMVLDAAAASGQLAAKLDLVDALQRLGVDYHYMKEIDALLRAVYDDDDEDGASASADDHDLYVTSLRFYLLRKHGYNVSSDVFVKFRDEQGNISSDDARTLMTLYDAAHMRVHGEGILDDIIASARSRLQALLMGTDLEPGLAEEVRVTLETTRFRRVERVEARRFISVYEKSATRDDTVLQFAKLDYNLVQVVYCNELKELTVWWMDLRSKVDLTFARDRLVETYFWMMPMIYEPYYPSSSRIVLTKMSVLFAMTDDMYDNYATTEESNIYTAAMETWDEKAAAQIPEHLRPFFTNFIRGVDSVVTELKLQNNKHAEVLRELALNMVKSYHGEVTWRDEHYVPADVDEHLEISQKSITAMQLLVVSFVSIGDDVTTREIIDWALTYPKIVGALSVIARILNDIMSHEREQASDHMASTVQTCMKQYGVTVGEAIEKLKEIVEKAWMDMVQECLDQKYPLVLLEKAVNFARILDFYYKSEDLFTNPSNLKPTLMSLFVEFV
ncbi:hypothetical protein BS78_07G038700 [Paspalum vaginatum]|nr:hypothetical protein BS78_07G038700 [Paspalum vaginatum]